MHDSDDPLHVGRDPAQQHGLVNPPVYRGSTVLFPTLQALGEAVGRPFHGVFYGRFGTPTHFALQDALTRLDGGHGTVLLPSGLAAVAVALQAFAGSGDHVLVVDCVYEPTRKFCDRWLAARYGVEVEYFAPGEGAGITRLLRPRTRVVLLESPGSLSFEVQDVPAITAAAHAHGARVVVDNTWATPLLCRPLALGADAVVHAATKYLSGHADLMLGAVVCNAATFETVRDAAVYQGLCAAPDDCWLTLRGLRTLDLRLRRHSDTALQLAQWLGAQPDVEAVLHPALPAHPGHALWQRDFSGSSGLFAAVLRPVSHAQVAAMVDGFQRFGMGFSWGGYESLALPVPAEYLRSIRSATTWPYQGPLLRLHAGLDDADALISELHSGFQRLRAATPDR